MVEAGKAKNLKVQELRQELESRGLSTEGKKDELVARLEEALVNEVAGDDEVADGVEDVGEGAAGEDDGDDEAAAAVEAAAAAAAEEAKQYKHSRISFNPAAAPAPAKITVVKADAAKPAAAAAPAAAAPEAAAQPKKISELSEEERKKAREARFKDSLPAAKLKERAMRFGVEYAPLEEEKKADRRKRFGIVSEADKKAEEGERLKARKDRFGLMSDKEKAAKERQELEEKKKKRAARFAAEKAAATGVPSDEKLQARAARFAAAGTSSAAAAAAAPAAAAVVDEADLTEEQKAKRARHIVFEPKK